MKIKPGKFTPDLVVADGGHVQEFLQEDGIRCREATIRDED
jgi:hypothetical protein